VLVYRKAKLSFDGFRGINMDDERRRKAEQWVNGYTATAVGTVLATALVPGAATAILCTLEATMCYQIGKIYKHEWSMGEATATAGIVGVASLVGQIAALEAAILAGPLAFIIKPAIAAGIVKAMGQLVIKHFEDASD
jgi:uncharacterized protein (DUF697 family)